MVVDGLMIPNELQGLLAAGKWPRTPDEERIQNLLSRIPDARRRKLRRIYLYAPPFHTVAKVVAGGSDFYAQFGVLHELVPEASVEIGDFGLGSDAPILLDYAMGPTEPRVIHLEWGDRGAQNRWVVMAESFAEFVELLGL